MASTIRGSDNFDSGSVGSTTFGDVGTYTVAHRVPGNDTLVTGGYTYAGSSLLVHQRTGTYPNAYMYYNSISSSERVSAGLSGTWRLMNPRQRINFTDTDKALGALWVRIS